MDSAQLAAEPLLPSLGWGPTKDLRMGYQVIEYYFYESNHDDFDRQAPVGFSVGMVPS